MFNNLFDPDAQYYVTLNKSCFIVEKLPNNFYYQKRFNTDGTFIIRQGLFIQFDAKKFIENILEENENSIIKVLEINDVEQKNKTATEEFLTLVKEIICKIPNIFMLRYEGSNFDEIITKLNVHFYYICDQCDFTLEDLYEKVNLPRKMFHVHFEAYNSHLKFDKDLYDLPIYTRANIVTLALSNPSQKDTQRQEDILDYAYKNGWQKRNHATDLIYYNTLC